MATVVDIVKGWKGDVLALAPSVSVILIVGGAIVYGLAQIQPAEKRGQWQSLAIGMVIGGIIIAAIYGAAETIIFANAKNLLT